MIATSTDAKANMKTSTKQSWTAVIVLAFASVLGGISVTSAFSKDNDDRRQHSDKGWHKGEWRGGRDDQREWRPVYRPDYREPYNYSQPVYVPPPVYYPPHQSPGISLFFPLDLR